MRMLSTSWLCCAAVEGGMPSGCSGRPSAASGAKGWLLLVAPIPCISRGSGVAGLFSEPVGGEEGEDRWLWSWPFCSAERQACSVVPKGYVWGSSDTGLWGTS